MIIERVMKKKPLKHNVQAVLAVLQECSRYQTNQLQLAQIFKLPVDVLEKRKAALGGVESAIHAVERAAGLREDLTE